MTTFLTKSLPCHLSFKLWHQPNIYRLKWIGRNRTKKFRHHSFCLSISCWSHLMGCWMLRQKLFPFFSILYNIENEMRTIWCISLKLAHVNHYIVSNKQKKYQLDLLNPFSQYYHTGIYVIHEDCYYLTNLLPLYTLTNVWHLISLDFR